MTDLNEALQLLRDGRRLHVKPVISVKESKVWHRRVDQFLEAFGNPCPEDRWDAPERVAHREKVAQILAESIIEK